MLALPALLVPFAAPAQQPGKKLTLQSEAKYQIPGETHSVAVSPDGKLVAVGTNHVYLHDISGPEPKKVGYFNTSIFIGVPALTFTPDGKHLIVGGSDGTVRVLSIAGKRETSRTKEHKGDVRTVAVSPDSKLVASGSSDQTAIVWDLSDEGVLKEKYVIRTEDKNLGTVQSVTFVSKGKGLYTVSPYGVFRGYSMAKGEPKQTGGFRPPKGGVASFCIVPNAAGTLFAVADDLSVFLVSPTGGTGAGTLVGHKETVTGVSFAPDGKLVATCGKDGHVIVWDVATKAAKYTKVRPGMFSAVAFSPHVNAATGEMTVVACQDDGAVHVMRLANR